MLGVALLVAFTAIIISYLSSRVAAKFGRELRNKVVSKVMSFSDKELKEFSIASLITRSTNDIQNVQNILSMIFRSVVFAPIMGIGAFIKETPRELLCSSLPCEEAAKRFSLPEENGFYLCDINSNELFMNPKETYDGAVPSGNSVMAYDLVKLYQITEKDEYREAAEKQIEYLSKESQGYPSGHCMFLIAKMLYEYPLEHITVSVKDDTDLRELRKALPFSANILISKDHKKYPILNDKTTYYVCKDNVCLPPSNRL